MNNGVATMKLAVEVDRIGEILDAPFDAFGGPVAGTLPRRHGPHVEAALQQFLDHVLADLAGGSGDQNQTPARLCLNAVTHDYASISSARGDSVSHDRRHMTALQTTKCRALSMSAALIASATIICVGLACPAVGNTELPTTKRPSTPCT